MNCPICKGPTVRLLGEDYYTHSCSDHYLELVYPTFTRYEINDKWIEIDISEDSKKRWNKHEVVNRWCRKAREAYLKEVTL